MVSDSEVCSLCGGSAHVSKSKKDQCRLFTALLGRGWARVEEIMKRVINDNDSHEEGDLLIDDVDDDNEEVFYTPNTSFTLDR